LQQIECTMCILVTYTRDGKNAVILSPFQVKHVYRGATTNLPYVLALWKDVKSSFFTYFSCLWWMLCLVFHRRLYS